MSGRISAIVPTIGRPASLTRLLASLAGQTHRVREVIVADGSGVAETAVVCADVRWREAGLDVTCIPVSPPHAVRQREAAIAASSGQLLLLLDDDVELETECVAELHNAIDSGHDVVGVMADFNNQAWPMPTRAWRLYLRLFHGLRDGAWQGRVLGPLLRFGYNPVPADNRPIEWLGSGNSLIRRRAYNLVGGFSGYFQGRASINEDVDLGLKLRRHGKLLFCPKARMAHFHARGGRLSHFEAGKDDLHNRYRILTQTMRDGRFRAFALVLGYWTVENGSALVGCMLRRRGIGMVANRAAGGLSGLAVAVMTHSAPKQNVPATQTREMGLQ